MATICRWCRSGALVDVLDLGAQPPADLFPWPADPRPDPAARLRMARCQACGLAQLVEDPGVAEAVLGAEPQALVRQAEQAVAAAARLLGGTFAEFDSPHGGSWRGLIRQRGGVDRTDGDEPVDAVVDVFGLMHEADQRAALERRVRRLADGGTLLLQFHALATIVRQRQWNALRHGHMAYYSVRTITGMLRTLGLHAHAAWEFELYGGTVLLAAGRRPGPPDGVLAALLARDAADPATLGQAAVEAVADLRSWLTDQRAQGRRVLGYGAASRAVPLLTRAGVGPELLPAVADAAPGKRGRAMPGRRIPIITPEQLVDRAPHAVLLFVPDLAHEVRAALPALHAAEWWVTEPRLHRL